MISEQVGINKWSLEGSLEVPKVGDMICSTPANGEMPKVSNPSIPKKIMAVVVSLHMIVETLMLIMML